MCDQSLNDESLELLDALEIGINLAEYPTNAEESIEEA